MQLELVSGETITLFLLKGLALFYRTNLVQVVCASFHLKVKCICQDDILHR